MEVFQYTAIIYNTTMNNLVFMSSDVHESLWVRCPELGLQGKSAVISVDTANEHAHSS